MAESLNEFREAAACVEEEVLAHHCRRGDVSRWVEHVFSDGILATLLRKVEARWARGEIGDLARAVTAPLELRYGP